MSNSQPSASCLALLQDLVAFNTTVDQPNRHLVRFIHRYLDKQGVRVRLTPETESGKRNLFFSIGPATDDGTVLAAHLDTPDSEQPCELRQENGVVYGAGVAESKGFIACVLASVPVMLYAELVRPIHVSLSYDETVGCVGVRDLLFELKRANFKAAQCLIGKPTGLLPVLESVGVLGKELVIESNELPHEVLKRLALGLLPAVLQAKGLFERRHPGVRLDVSRCLATLSSDGQARRVLIRLTLHYQDATVAEAFEAWANDLLSKSAAELLDQVWHQASVRLRPTRAYPASSLSAHHPFVHWLTANTHTEAFAPPSQGSEAGLYQQQLKLPTLLCGPGRHDSDGQEQMPLAELAACERLLQQLIDWHRQPV